MDSMKAYQDHTGLWADELSRWVPDTIFDAHVHLGPTEAVGNMSPERLKEALSTYTSFTWEQAQKIYSDLYSGKTIAGAIAFGFPQREVNLEAANEYIINLMRTDPKVKGFVLSHPTDTARTIDNFNLAPKADVRFMGVKPYFDRLGKSNFDTKMEEFLPKDLLEFMNAEELVMMLHTSGVGMSDADNQNFIKKMAAGFPKIKIILAHMGRYTQFGQFFDFLDSDIMDCPSIFLEMSSASESAVYKAALARKDIHDRLIFGSDLPFGLITGVEHWSEEKGAVFISRDSYSWSDVPLNEKFTDIRSKLSYNTYHTIKALKDAIEELKFSCEEAELLKKKIFLENALLNVFG